MARIARVVIPDYPHHIIHRGNRREKIFFNVDDKQAYLDFLIKQAKRCGIEFWAYCLMDNHVHFIAVPKKEDSLARGLAQTHKEYTRRINFRNNWRGHLWEGRFKSCVLSQKHLYAAVRYVERNPVRAGMVKRAEDYLWSSAKAHVHKTQDRFLSDSFLIEEISNWRNYLADDSDDKKCNMFIGHVDTGRPLGDKEFIEELEGVIGKSLKRKKPGPKKKEN
ncbi:MAG TPA: transposase [Candidatus Omnitrophica bacterium]|nr:transposase [Candidatus Omnitrophota bacterium]